MDYFRSTFFDKYTPLTEEQIFAALTPVPRAKSVSPRSDALSGQTLRFILDGEPALEYTFTEETLTLREGDNKPIEAPYTAMRLAETILFTHMIPGTMRGYCVILDTKTELVTAFEVWFGGFEPDKREVWRHFAFGYVEREGKVAPTLRHGLTNRIEGTGTHWKNDDDTEMLYFFPSVVWSSFVELSNPRGGITITAPSDYIKINDRLYIYSRVEQEFSGAFTLEVIDLFTVTHIGVRLGFDKADALDYAVYCGKGEVTGRSTNLEPLTNYGTEIPFEEVHRTQFGVAGRGGRPSYRPRFLHKDYTQDEVDEIIRTNLSAFRGQSIMSSFNTMEASGYMVGKTFALRYDDGPVWEYSVIDGHRLKWRMEGDEAWNEELYEGYEPAKDIILFSHICTDSRPLRCAAHAVDFSNSLTTLVDARLGGGQKPWEVANKSYFGVLECKDAPEPPAVLRHGVTTELVGRAFSWTYGANMQSIHVYSSPQSYSWTIMLPNNTGGWMWSSPCLYVKLRDDAYLMSWTEDGCNGNQGTFVFNPWIMHDAGFFFGVGDTEERDDVHLTPLGAFGRPLHGFDIMKYFDPIQK
jgi:hypothetical protein